MTGCLLLLMELVLIANTFGPGDAVLYKYCADQSLESTLELLERELRLGLELILIPERLLKVIVIERPEPLLMESPSLAKTNKGYPEGASNTPSLSAGHLLAIALARFPISTSGIPIAMSLYRCFYRDFYCHHYCYFGVSRAVPHHREICLGVMRPHADGYRLLYNSSN